MNHLRAAILGTGFMGPAHLEALRRLGVTIVGIAGSTEEKSRQAAARLGLAKGYRSWQDALDDPQVDVVHICTPNRVHHEMARAAIQAGKHVLCEKPLAMNSRESAELVALAAAHPMQAAGVNYNIRHYPLCIEARERLRRGELGDVLHICGSYVQDWLLWPTDYNWRVQTQEGGELRAVSDIGTHWLDLICSITGLEVEAVFADLRTVHPIRQRPRGEVETYQGKLADAQEREPVAVTTDDYGCVLLRLAGGAKGCLWVSQVTAGRKNCLRFEIAGGKQALAWDSERPNELWLGRRDEANAVLLKDPALLSPAARQAADYPGGHNEGYADSFKQCFRAFYGYIAANDCSAPAPFASFADGHREILLCEAILASSRQERWVAI